MAQNKAQQLVEILDSGYTSKGVALLLGAALYEGEALSQARVKVPLKTLNRHGLIAGATGTGKTKTLQVLIEGLSEAGVPCLAMDIKGDLSGLAMEGQSNAAIEERHQRLGLPFAPAKFPVELLSLSGKNGARLRATASEFGPNLLARILELNETQESVLSVLFHYADSQHLPLLDIKDIKELLRFAGEEGKDKVEAASGKLSSSTLGIILRKLVELEQSGAGLFFGEPSFEVEDLLSVKAGKGVIHIVRLDDMQDKPRLFSTFMMCLLAEIYAKFPEEGDLEKPKLCLFIDEAHLLFDNAPKALREQIERVVRLIRSKGIGVFFCTQSPADIPEEVLGQLGMKIQHALRAFTAKDRQELKLAAQNYPDSEFYDSEKMLTSMGIGEAAVTVLSERGQPTPLAHVLLRAPRTRMGALKPDEISGLLERSALVAHYAKDIDRESAAEILSLKLKGHDETEEEEPEREAEGKAQRAPKPEPRRPAGRPSDSLGKTVAKEAGRVVVREVIRGLFGVLTGRPLPSRRRRRGIFF